MWRGDGCLCDAVQSLHDQMQDERSLEVELLRGTHGQRREREPVPGVHVARLYDYCV